MSNLAKGHSGLRTASLRFEGLSAHSLMFTLETETAQMLCWRPQTNKQTNKRNWHNPTELQPVHEPLRPRKGSRTATETEHLSECGPLSSVPDTELVRCAVKGLFIILYMQSVVAVGEGEVLVGKSHIFMYQ